jgi:hypothetical protein
VNAQPIISDWQFAALLALCRAFYSAELDEHFRAGEPEPWECDRAERLSEARPLLESLSRLGV